MIVIFVKARTLAALLLALAPAAACAHDVDTHDHASPGGPGRWLRFDYANDFFVATDRYYTQGIGLTYSDPALKRSWPMRLLPALPGGERSYALTLRHSGFTPTSLSSEKALVGDRPFAAYLFLGHDLVSDDPSRRLRLTTGLDVGIIGPGAGGKWMQKSIHRALNNLQPQGWDNQVHNDLALDAHALLEKDLAWGHAGSLAGFADAALGTLHTNAALGLSARLGTRRLFLSARAEQRFIGYDAALQGGLFNRSSPYTLDAAAVRRTVFRGDIGACYDAGSFAVSGTRTFLGPEFSTGLSHQWFELSFLRRF